MADEATTTSTETALSGGGGQQQQQTQQVQPIGNGDWLVDGKFGSGISSRLPDDLKPYSVTIQKFEGTPIGDVLKSYGELEKKLGQRAAPPKPDAKPEEVAAWRKVTGAPDKPEGYEIKRPDDVPAEMWSDDLVKGFAEVAHKHHLSPAAAAELVKWWNDQQKGAFERAQQASEAETTTQIQGLKTEWGEKFPVNIAAAQRVAGLAKIDVNDPAVGNNPAVIRALHAMSVLISDDKQVTGGGAAPNLTMKQQADAIQNDPANPWYADYHGTNGPERQSAAAEKLRALRAAA